MANNGWETDDEAETDNLVWSHDQPRSKDPSADVYANEDSLLDTSRKLSSQTGSKGRGRGDDSLLRHTRSFYEVERIPNRLPQLYPGGPEVITRLKHSGYPELTEKRFRQRKNSDSGDEDVDQRVLIGMPTASYASDIESEGGDISGANPPTIQSTERFLLSLQKSDDSWTEEKDQDVALNGESGGGNVRDEDSALSDTETVKAEDDEDKDVSHFAMPSLIAQQERAWRAQAMQRAKDELQDLLKYSSEEDSPWSDLESLQDGSVSSDKTPSLYSSQAASSSKASLSGADLESSSMSLHSSASSPKAFLSGADLESSSIQDSDETYRVEDVQILPGELQNGEGFYSFRPRDESQKHFDEIRRFLSSEGEDSPLIDLRIRVQGREFQTHRLVMVTFSRYFRQLNDQGHLKPFCIVVMDSLSPEGFARVLDWINTSRLELNPENVSEVLRVSTTLGVSPVVEKCRQYLALMRSQNDHTALYEYAMRNGLQGALHQSGMAAASDFPDIRRSRKYLQYTADQICLLLCRDDLQIERETDVYDVACDWLLQAWDTRQKHVAEVMQCVRFKLMSPFELRDILLQSPNPIALNVHVIFMLLHALLYLALKAVGHVEPGLGPVPLPRICLKRSEWVSSDSSTKFQSSEETSGSVHSGTTNTKLLGRSSLATDQKELLTSATTLVLSSDKTTSSSTSATTTTFESDEMTSASALVASSASPMEARAPKKVHAKPLRKRKPSRNVAAARIQAAYRGHLVRKHVRHLDRAAMIIQKTFRGHLVRQELLEREKAAAAIQRGYRRYIDHKKYNFLTAAASYSPSRRATKLERSNEQTKWPQRPYFYLPPDPAFVCFGGITTDAGADLGQVASCIYGFDIQSDEWQLCGTMPEPRADAAACLLGNSLILTGGYDPTGSPATSTSTAWKLDVLTGEWEAMPSMHSARRLHGQVIADGKVYVVGGCGDGNRPLSATEMYDPQLNRWTEVGPLEVPRYAAAVASHRDQIWVCGGIVGVDKSQIRKITHQVEVYDPQHDKWSKQKSLPAPRAFCDLVSVDDAMLLIAGGVEGSFNDEEVDLTSTILSFDFEHEKWRYLMNLPGNRYKAKIVSRDPYWFVVGGQSTISGPSLSTVECFDTHDQRWVAIPHLPVSLQGICCIALP